ncbi:MAG: ribonuclease R [Bacteroidales bacterium]|nr:ribonuclease R [Bacteroidales bacterium]NMD01719.1 ribonuclease R [Bacteroidales bacterium]HOU01696.1 ribonuclease R [Bacteroidales bacterium]HQK67004.1 ribonuclease R [Bacteroidales bacterium]
MSRKGRGKKKAVITPESVKEQVLAIISKSPAQGFNYKQISKRLNINDPSERKMVSDILRELSESGTIEEINKGKYRAKVRRGYITGTVDMTRMGYGFVKSEDIEEDVFVAARNLRTALHGDKVKVLLLPRRKGSRPEGEVVEIIERWRNTFVGTVEIMPNFAFLIPDNRNMPFDLFIPSSKLNGARQGQKAVAKITDWNTGSKNPVAEIVEVLGEPGLHETEMHAILAEFELPYRFTEEVEKDAETIRSGITTDEIKTRRDFRQVFTLTIDPADAKDFDDALSLKKLDNGNWEVGVHIADVTYYVKQGSLTEEEAKQRATSVYLVDRVVPMLPERLSNNICSLNPSEDKLTYSAVFELNEKSEILNEWYGRTIINSNRRFSYEEVQEIIDKGEGELRDEILVLHKLAQNLRTRRYAGGAFSFEKVEVQFDLDDEGRPLGIKFRQMGTANQLIEEFMILANLKVAELVGKKMKGKTFVYRVHDKPDPEKISDFSHFITRFGYKLIDDDVTSLPKSMNKLLGSIAGKKEQNIIETLALRAMAKAVYSTDNIGHYGLALKYYTHFTSPIRRYPDMMVHRLLTSYLDGGKPEEKGKFEKLCEHSSKMERLATEAERASIKYKQVEFMSDKTGKEFEGIISGVTEWGLYVEIIENQCEGMINVRELDDDYYEYDEENYCLRGRSGGKVYTLGDKITIEVVKADLQKKQLDYRLARPRQ